MAMAMAPSPSRSRARAVISLIHLLLLRISTLPPPSARAFPTLPAIGIRSPRTARARLPPAVGHRGAGASSPSDDGGATPEISPSVPVASSDDATASPTIAASAFCHHVAIKTRDIESAANFYSLLGFRAEAKFVAGPARAAWLLHDGGGRDGDSNASPRSRIELLEVPSYMLDEPEGRRRRAIDLARREELLGLNHVALDVTSCIPRPGNDGGASEDGTACALYQLQEWMDDLNALSVERFGRSIRVALPPTKRIIGRKVYEMAFIYDADGALVELLNHSSTLLQEVGDGWEPWDGSGFVR